MYTKLPIDSLGVICIKEVNMKSYILKLLLLHKGCASPRHKPTNKKNMNIELRNTKAN